MITQHISAILITSGIITMLAYLNFFATDMTLKATKGEPFATERDRFFYRSWGLAIGAQGVLLIASAYMPEIRNAIMIFAGVNKTLYCAMILQGLPQPYAKAQVPGVAFDAVCVLLFIGYALGF